MHESIWYTCWKRYGSFCPPLCMDLFIFYLLVHLVRLYLLFNVSGWKGVRNVSKGTREIESYRSYHKYCLDIIQDGFWVEYIVFNKQSYWFLLVGLEVFLLSIEEVSSIDMRDNSGWWREPKSDYLKVIVFSYFFL